MKKIISIALLAAMIFVLPACGSRKSEDHFVGPAGVNPMVEADENSILQEIGVSMKAPDGAENVKYFIYRTENPIAEVRFTFEGNEYNYRKSPADKFSDISGMFYTWQHSGEAKIDYCDAAVSWNDSGEGIILWYEIVPGIMHSLSMTENADMETLTAMASAIFEPAQGDAP